MTRWGYVLAAAVVGLFIGAPAAAQTLLTPSSVVTLAAKRDTESHSSFYWIARTNSLIYSQVANGQDGSQIFRIDMPSGARTRVGIGENPIPSPDGKALLYERPDASISGPKAVGGSGLQLWAMDIDGAHARQLTHAAHGICTFVAPAWSPDSTRIVYDTCSLEYPKVSPSARGATVVVTYPLKVGADWIHTVHLVDVAGGGDRILFRHKGEFGFGFSWLDSTHLLYEHDNTKPVRFIRSSLSVFDTATGRVRSVLSGYNWQTYYRPALSPNGQTVAFTGDPHEATYFESRNEIGLLDVRTKRVRLLQFTKDQPPSRLAWAPDGKWLLYTNGTSTRGELYATDGTNVHQLTSGDGINSAPVFSESGRYIAWLQSDGEGRSRLRAGDWKNGSIASSRTLLVLSNPLARITAGTTRVVRWKSFDGLTIDGYLTLPARAKAGRYPTIVLLHGGPTGRNSVDSSEWPGAIYFIEYLAQRGYAVFQPDYRESGYFGYNRILQTWSRKHTLQEDYADIAAGIDSLERQGIADPAKLFILGHSYGSILANWAISHDRRFRAAVSFEGTDYFINWSGRYGTDPLDELRVGGTTPLTAPSLWAANSAVLNAAHIRTPTLFIGTENGIDSFALPWLAGALRSAGVDSQYLFYRGEQHVLLQQANQQDLIERVMQWLTSH